MVLRAVLISSLLVGSLGSLGCRDRSVKVRELTQKDLDGDPELAREVEAAKRQLGNNTGYGKPTERADDTPTPAEIQASADAMTAGAIPGEKLAPFVPKQLGGIAVTQPFDQAYAAGGAYQLPDGGYANLDIQNTFIRGSHDDSLEKLNDRGSLCPTHEKILGHVACVKVGATSDGGTSIRWYLPDRLSVRIAAPTEALARKLAADLPLAALAKLSAAHE